MHKGLSTRGNPFFFGFGRIWAQNHTQLPRKSHIVLTHNMRVDAQCESHVAMPKTCLANLQRNSQAVHERAIGVPERVQPAKLDS